MGTGTQYETELLADTLAEAWHEDQNFREPKAGDFAFEPLEHSKAPAKKLGFSIVYDSRFKKSAFPNPNFTGAVPPGEWPGLTAKNVGRYTYAIDQMRLHARPALPTSGGDLVAPSDPKEFAVFAAKLAEELKRSVLSRDSYSTATKSSRWTRPKSL